MGRKTWPDGHPYHGGHWLYRGTRNAIYLRDRLACVYCGSDTLKVERERGDFTVDHIVPVSAGGDRKDPKNLVTCCMLCNRTKGALSPLEAFGADAVRRVRAAVRRKVPPSVEGRRLHFEFARCKSRVWRAQREGWLTPASLAELVPSLPFPEPDDYVEEAPSDDIPF